MLLRAPFTRTPPCTSAGMRNYIRSRARQTDDSSARAAPAATSLTSLFGERTSASRSATAPARRIASLFAAAHQNSNASLLSQRESKPNAILHTKEPRHTEHTAEATTTNTAATKKNLGNDTVEILHRSFREWSRASGANQVELNQMHYLVHESNPQQDVRTQSIAATMLQLRAFAISRTVIARNGPQCFRRARRHEVRRPCHLHEGLNGARRSDRNLVVGCTRRTRART